MAEGLKGKVAIVTGGDARIGAATGQSFAHEGARGAILARRDAGGAIFKV